MIPFNLEEYLKNPSREIVTRDGRSVRIHCTNHWTDYNETPKPIIAEIQGIGFSESFTEDGNYYNNTCKSKRDLFFASKKHEGWINIFKSSNDIAFLGQSRIFESKEDAEKNGKDCDCYASTVKVEWED